MIRRSRRLAPLLLAGLLAAPPALAQSAFLSGGAAMRIEVEVYKGPLAKDIRSQIAEFHGLLRQTHEQFDRVDRQIELWVRVVGKDCLSPADQATYLKNKNPISHDRLLGTAQGEKGFQCAFAARISEENKALKSHLAEFANPGNKILQNALDALDTEKSATAIDNNKGQAAAAAIRHVATRATAFARQISRSAQNWQEIQTAAFPNDATLRAIITSYQFAAAEQANQIASRADALLQQIDGLDRRELPLSAFIAGSAPTDFARLFEWNDAYTYAGSSSGSVEDRVKILERLQADMHWARVNTVFASGRGDVSMAFIKDDIGNWSLKQFDNAPGELLKAYTGVAQAALSTATKLATGFAGGSTAGIQQLVGLADALSFGDSAAPGQARPPIDLRPARARLQARLDDIARLAAEQETGITEPEKKKAHRAAVETEIRAALIAYQSTLDLLDDATQPAGGASLSSLPGGLPGSVAGNLPGLGGVPQIPGR